MDMTKNQRDILDHTLHRATNRQYCGDSADMQELVKLGLMIDVGKKGFCSDKFFQITGAGKQALSGDGK